MADRRLKKEWFYLDYTYKSTNNDKNVIKMINIELEIKIN